MKTSLPLGLFALFLLSFLPLKLQRHNRLRAPRLNSRLSKLKSKPHRRTLRQRKDSCSKRERQ